MAERASKALWIIVATVFAAATVVPTAAVEEKVPCYFVFGDSVFDNGNNNVLNTKAKVNYLPYGIDFPQGPTGRFSNGRNMPDVIANLLGFNDSIPPLVGASRAQANIGLNYASGAAGIREETSQNMGQRITLRQQIDNHRSAILRAAVPQDKLEQCLYTISIGSNDYLNNYFLSPPTPARLLLNPDQFANSLVSRLRVYLRTLYELGARKVVLFGVGKIGCIPRVVASLGNGTGCAEEVNEAAIIFNRFLTYLINEYNQLYSETNFTYVDLFSGNASDFAAFGVTVSDRSCCLVAAGEELCTADGPVCPDRNKYVFWDNVHPTELVNVLIANAAFNGTISIPYSISQLVNSN